MGHFYFGLTSKRSGSWNYSRRIVKRWEKGGNQNSAIAERAFAIAAVPLYSCVSPCLSQRQESIFYDKANF